MQRRRLRFIGNTIFTTVYSPTGGDVIKVIAGLAPLNGYSLVPTSVINIYLMTFTRAILSDGTLVTSIPPVSCSGRVAHPYCYPAAWILWAFQKA